jgi:hypothetical protein
MDERAKGFKYKVVAVNGEIETLYCKSMEQVSLALKDWEDIAFRVSSLKTPQEELRDLGLYL